jgi:opine dehydrogenase
MTEMETRPRIVVCGSGNAGTAIAADCAFMGFEVDLFELPALEAQLRPIREAGGIVITETSESVSGKTGFALLSRITLDPAEVVPDGDVIMITVPAMYHTVFFEAIEPYLRDGQIILFNTAYWACLRHADRLNAISAKVILAESNIMPYASQRDAGNAVHITRYKRHFRVAAFPGREGEQVYQIVRQIYPQFELVETVLDIDVASGGNPALTAPMAIPMAGLYFDRFRGGKLGAMATSPGSRLLNAFDADRRRLAEYVGSTRFEREIDYYCGTYGYTGDDMALIMRKSDTIDWYATSEYVKQLIDEDLLYCYVPMVRFAASLGVELAATRGMVDVLGVMLEMDYWGQGPRLEDLGIAGMDLAQIKSFLFTGDPDAHV